MNTDVLIVGAGLSGLRIAHQLKQNHVQAIVVDARSRIGGRIHSLATGSDDFAPGIDMGPSWFWPWQARMLALVKELELQPQVFEQYCEGLSVAEYRTGRLERQSGMASMAGSLRISGGLRVLIEKLSQDLDSASILNNSTLSHATHTHDGISATVVQASESLSIQAKRLVFAAPPRVIANTVTVTPPFAATDLALMHDTPTWMAGQAKFAATYSSPFWREQGLSGDGVSEIGPLGEIHDASSPTGAPYALFGFVGIPASARVNRGQEIKQAAVEQLVRMFGESAKNPEQVFFKDWAEDDFTSTQQDRDGQRGHAHQTVDTSPMWDDRLFWAGSETASISTGDNGYLEGALAAADRAVQQLMSSSAE